MPTPAAIYHTCKGCDKTFVTRNLSPINSDVCTTCKTKGVIPKPSQKPPPCTKGRHHWKIESPTPGRKFGQGTCEKCGITWGGFRMWEPEFTHIDISRPAELSVYE